MLERCKLEKNKCHNHAVNTKHTEGRGSCQTGALKQRQDNVSDSRFVISLQDTLQDPRRLKMSHDPVNSTDTGLVSLSLFLCFFCRLSPIPPHLISLSFERLKVCLLLKGVLFCHHSATDNQLPTRIRFSSLSTPTNNLLKVGTHIYLIELIIGCTKYHNSSPNCHRCRTCEKGLA